MQKTLLSVAIALSLSALSPAQFPASSPESEFNGASLIRRYHQAHTALERLAKDSAAQNQSLSAELKVLLHELESKRDRLGVPAQPDGPQILIELRLIEVTRAKFEGFMSKHLQQKDATLKHDAPLMLNTAMANVLKSETNAISAPSLITNAGERALIEVGGGETAPYLARRPDGSYEMKTHQTDDGISIGLVATPSANGKGIRCSIQGHIRKTMGKTPIKEDAETIGLPIMTERKFESDFTSLNRGSVCIPLFTGQQEHGLNLVVLCTTELLSRDGTKRKHK